MKLVVDSNILFTYFWKNSVTKRILIKKGYELFTPELAEKEINKYEQEIIEKTKITQEEFKRIKRELKIVIKFIAIKEYEQCIKTATEISPDKNDIEFLALALKLQCPIWSNDYKLKEQKKCQIITTKEIIELYE